MLLTPKRAAFFATLLLLLLVFVTHLGSRSGYYRSSRAEAGYASFCAADGYSTLHDGIPVMTDASHILRLGRLYRGEPPGKAGGVMDERPLVPFLQSLAGAGFLGELWPAILLNLLAVAAASACAADLLLRAGHRALTAGAFACLLVAGRGTGFYIGTPDVHLIACAWLPIGAWAFDRLDLANPQAPRSNVVAFGLLLGAALLTYLGCVAVLGFTWIYGLRRTPLRRLVALSVIALSIAFLWRVLGRAIGLPFDAIATGTIGDGLRIMGRTARETFANVWSPPRGASRGGFANACLQTLRRFFWDGDPARIMFQSLRPGFGDSLLLAAAAGLACASRLERRRAIALFLPSVVAAWPINTTFSVPRISYPGVAGLALLAAIALSSFAGWVKRQTSARGLGERAGQALELSVVSLPILAFALHENQDVLGLTRGHTAAPLWLLRPTVTASTGSPTGSSSAA